MAKRGRYSRGPVGFTRMTDRRVMRFVAPEKKFLDVLRNPAEWKLTLNHATAGIIGTLENSDIAGTLGGFIQGAGASQRIGSKISIDSISCRLQFTQLGYEGIAGILAPVQFRLMLVLDKQPNGTIASISNPGPPDTSILTASTTGGAGTTDIFDYSLYQRNLSSSARFTVLYDKVHVLNRDTSMSTLAGPVHYFTMGAVAKTVVINKKFKKPILREFATGAPTGAAEAVMKNQFLMLLLPVGGASAGIDDLECTGDIRFRFTDA